MTLPVGWTAASLDDITFVRGSKADPAILGEFPFIGLEHIEPHKGELTGLGSARDVRSTVAEFKSGDILFGRLRPYLNKVIQATFDGCASAEIVAFVPEVGINAALVKRLLMSEKFLAFTAALDRGDRPRVAAHEVGRFELDLPPSAEQNRIVAKLDLLTACIARARKELGRVPLLASRLRQKALSDAVSGLIATSDQRAKWTPDDIAAIAARRLNYVANRKGSRLHSEFDTGLGLLDGPRGAWLDCRLADVVDLRVGYAFKSADFVKDGAGIPLLRGANIAPGTLDWSDKVLLPTHIASSHTRFLVEEGDIVIAMDRPIISGGLKIARVGAQDSGALLVQRVANPRHSTWVSPEYLMVVLQSHLFIQQIEDRATGSDLPHISANDILMTRCPLPPIKLQRQIAEAVEKVFAHAHRLESEAARSSGLLLRLESAILGKAFRGELVPQDPNDEPASVLLERIRAQRAAAPQAKRGRRVKE